VAMHRRTYERNAPMINACWESTQKKEEVKKDARLIPKAANTDKYLQVTCPQRKPSYKKLLHNT